MLREKYFYSVAFLESIPTTTSMTTKMTTTEMITTTGNHFMPYLKIFLQFLDVVTANFKIVESHLE